MATRAAQREQARQEATKDTKFCDTATFIFELRIPSAALTSPSTSDAYQLYYPLVVSPESYSIEEPFTVAISPGTNGGLVVEENGVIQRRIRLQGSTGFAPRPLVKSGDANAAFKVKNSYPIRYRYVDNQDYSGQRHFQFLQDRVFRTYADMKRDPTYAKETELFFHNLKDDESWRVIPESFSLERSAGGGPLYRYAIQLTAVEAAAYQQPAAFKRPPVEKSWWDKIKDFARGLKDAIAIVREYANLAQQFLTQVSQVVANVVSVFTQVLDAIQAVADFLNGVTNVAVGAITQIAQLATKTREVGVAIYKSVAGIPLAVAQAWYGMADQFETMVATLKATYSEGDATIQSATRGFVRTRNRNRALTASFSAETAFASSQAGLGQSGTALTTADVASILNNSNLGAVPPRINSLQSYEVAVTDTLSAISQRFLGSAKFWPIIAQINKLRPPYISAIPLPDTVLPGGVLLVPSTAPSISSGSESGILGSIEDDWEVRQLFRDVKLTQSSRHKNKLDLSPDALKGNKDVEYVAGIPNLKQAVHTRLETILGENVLYPSLGFPNVIGVQQPLIDAAILRLVAAQSISGDGRIQSIENITVSNTTSLDFYELDISAAVKGFTNPVQVEAARRL